MSSQLCEWKRVVPFHTQMAKQTGASCDEVISAILSNESWRILYWVRANSGQILVKLITRLYDSIIVVFIEDREVKRC